MAPFIVNHPTLLHKWIYCREKALKEIRSLEVVNINELNFFKECLIKSKASIISWVTESKYQDNKIKSLIITFLLYLNFCLSLNFKIFILLH